ncbi:hypothetical protein [Sphingomonas sp.]|uniref:hypothetical protein n=1 Tax=Sphingomonas sp. TaxID=28214 RepID=UPI001B1ACCF6|nr:hypothetical protein [Sphingomonas sp.]MBO9714262.1 hypothetical protein [Sphingomonas sp.]
MSAAPYRAITLAIHPNSRGFGWAAFTSPFSPYDWGSVSLKGKYKNERCLDRVQKLVRQLTPQTLVLEAFEDGSAANRPRFVGLCRAIVALATAEGIEVAAYRFIDVRSCFVHLGAMNRYQIACAIARQFIQFAHYLPRKRRPWDSQAWRASLFCAVALALTHYQLDAREILRQLSG